MAIIDLNSRLAAVEKRVSWNKTASRTSVANIPFGVFDLAGNPGAGSAPGNTVNGIVPTDALAGYPTLPVPSNTLYLGNITLSNSVACWMRVYDTLWSGGAYAFNANQTLSSQPSYSGRLENAGDYSNLELWVEAVTNFTGNPTITIGYMDQGGNTGATTGAVATGAALTAGRMVPMPLAAGDSGLQKVETVLSAVASAGTFNVHVLRPIKSVRILAANYGEVVDLFKLGMPKIYGDSALRVLIQADSTATGLPWMEFLTLDG